MFLLSHVDGRDSRNMMRVRFYLPEPSSASVLGGAADRTATNRKDIKGGKAGKDGNRKAVQAVQAGLYVYGDRTQTDRHDLKYRPKRAKTVQADTKLASERRRHHESTKVGKYESMKLRSQKHDLGR